jgi:hypothetical protein
MASASEGPRAPRAPPAANRPVMPARAQDGVYPRHKASVFNLIPSRPCAPTSRRRWISRFPSARLPRRGTRRTAWQRVIADLPYAADVRRLLEAAACRPLRAASTGARPQPAPQLRLFARADMTYAGREPRWSRGGGAPDGRAHPRLCAGRIRARPAWRGSSGSAPPSSLPEIRYDAELAGRTTSASSRNTPGGARRRVPAPSSSARRAMDVATRRRTFYPSTRSRSGIMGRPGERPVLGYWMLDCWPASRRTSRCSPRSIPARRPGRRSLRMRHRAHGPGARRAHAALGGETKAHGGAPAPRPPAHRVRRGPARLERPETLQDPAGFTRPGSRSLRPRTPSRWWF